MSSSVIEKDMGNLVFVIQELSLARNKETVMRIVRSAARQLTGADGATFILLDKEECYYADEDAISPLWKGSRFPLEACISGWVILNKTPVCIQDIYLDNRIPHDAYKPTFVKSLAMVPIRTIDPIGAIGIYWAKQRETTEEEIELLQSLANVTAVTIENINVYTELEQRVKDRTADLEAANKSLEAFSYSVSHDLRAPLRSVSGFFQILHDSLSEKFTDVDKDTTERITRNISYMEQLIDGLLMFSRTGRQPLAKSMVSAKNMVDEICANSSDGKESRDIKFSIASLPDILADPVLLKQVWTNLIYNAIKYTRKKEKALIEIGFEEKSDVVLYYVKDNGVGFNMAHADKLFGVFQRMHSQKDFEGIGIGLSIADSIIKRHEGKIWADAKINEGATFYFSLPSHK